LPFLDDAAPTLILAGDVPLTKLNSLQALVQAAGANKLGILTVQLDDPIGYGRIVRKQGKICAIVEHKDATPAQRAINEVNSGIMIMPTPQLKIWLAKLSNNNAQGEYYLTDVISQAVADGMELVSVQPEHEWETLGVNNKAQLASLERIYQTNQAQTLLEQGVTLLDPARIDIRGSLQCGRDVVIDLGCIFEGEVVLEDGVQIDAYCVIKDAHLASKTHVKPYCHIEGGKVGAASQLGPYTRLRPGTVLENEVHVGNFVEVKNCQIAAHSKANHLTYLGDATIGARVNIGAGTITCNYDGVNKSHTMIEDDAFIGSDSQLIAPVTVGKGATLGAGTTLVNDAPAGQLTLSRAKQVSVPGWKRPVRK
jgi:bifunctional UDP-N-acetylglucosamine pyrophosphorylase/glucosamine-1-phosphate N-acetyltransferase